eukprot:m.245890 g.245890  ORF g.245890 m.245890 type:complete len:610 (-) comp33841_c0_seq5:382-2211(-)
MHSRSPDPPRVRGSTTCRLRVHVATSRLARCTRSQLIHNHEADPTFDVWIKLTTIMITPLHMLALALIAHVRSSFGLVPGATLTYDFITKPSMNAVGAYSTHDVTIEDCPWGGANQAGMSNQGFSFIFGEGLLIRDAPAILGGGDYSFVWDVTFIDSADGDDHGEYKILTVGSGSLYGLFLDRNDIRIRSSSGRIAYDDNIDYQLIFTWSQTAYRATVYLHDISAGSVESKTWNPNPGSREADALQLSNQNMVFFSRYRDKCNDLGSRTESHVRSIQVWDRTLTSADADKIVSLRGEVLEFACQYVSNTIITSLSLTKHKADLGAVQSMSDCISLVEGKCAWGTTAVRDDDNGRCYCWATNLDALKDDVTSNVRACPFRTMAPTLTPSASPTLSPTNAPTQSPTAPPTTPSPSPSPTTPSPTTSAPTTRAPTTRAPTTRSPATVPSKRPTTRPTRSPTTTKPTRDPTVMPTTASTLSEQLTSSSLGSTVTLTPLTTSSPTPSSANTERSSSGAGSSTTAGVVVGVFVIILVAVVLVVLLMRRRNSEQQKESNPRRKPSTTTIPAFMINPGSKGLKPQFDNKALIPLTEKNQMRTMSMVNLTATFLSSQR